MEGGGVGLVGGGGLVREYKEKKTRDVYSECNLSVPLFPLPPPLLPPSSLPLLPPPPPSPSSLLPLPPPPPPSSPPPFPSSLYRAMEKRLTRLVSDCESEVEQRRARESRILELEKELAIMRLEQKETTRKLEGQEEEKKNVSVRGGEGGGRVRVGEKRGGGEGRESFHTLDFLSSSSPSSSFLSSFPLHPFPLPSPLPFPPLLCTAARKADGAVLSGNRPAELFRAKEGDGTTPEKTHL